MNNNAIFNTSDIFCVSESDIAHITEQAKLSDTGRFRICLHQSTDDLIQEMLIAMSSHSRLTPHKRPGTRRTYSIIQGQLRLVLFSEKGTIQSTLDMTQHTHRFVRLSADFFILPIPLTPNVVLHEIAEGPFMANDEYATWYNETQYTQLLNGIENE
jgi:cupin fold WbuC family metalloprotein